MYEQVDTKLGEADWFLEKIMSLRDSYQRDPTRGGICHVYDPQNAGDLVALRSCIDGLLFVLTSTQGVLLQEVAKNVPGFRRSSSGRATLANMKRANGASVGDSEFGWYARLDRYRNATAHRCVLQESAEWKNTSGADTQSRLYLPDDPDKPTWIPYEKEDLFEYLVCARANMEAAVALWEAGFGLKMTQAL
jgi:hypothetical protein